jgi:hypothetical protein
LAVIRSRDSHSTFTRQPAQLVCQDLEAPALVMADSINDPACLALADTLQVLPPRQ